MFIVIIIALVALYVWYKLSHYNDTPWVKERIKGRTQEQAAVIRYFCNEPSCLSKKPITDEQYDQLVLEQIRKFDFKKKALDKIGLDEDQVKEIEPVHFEGFQFGKPARFSRLGHDGKWRSSNYQVSWLFFSATQVYLYQYTFNMDEDGRKEATEEYFYKDITNFATSSDTEETPVYNKQTDKVILENVNTNRFVLRVPGASFYCAMDQNDDTEASIQGLKSLLREKKA